MTCGRIKWSRDQWRHVRDSERSNPQYLENNWRCSLETIDNYYLVCYEAVRAAILAIAWLLVVHATPLSRTPVLAC